MARKRKRELELEVLRLQLQLDNVTAERNRLQGEFERYAEKANNLEWQFRAERDQAKDLQEQVQKLTVDKAVLMERLELVAAGIGNGPSTPNGLPLPKGHEPEEIEDARYALSAGRINHAEFNALLEQYGFSNTEVEIDGTGTPQF